MKNPYFAILAVLIVGLFVLGLSLSPAFQTFVAPTLPTFSYIHQLEAEHLRCDDTSRTCYVITDKPFTLTQPLRSGDFKFEPPDSTTITSWINKDGSVRVKFEGRYLVMKPNQLVELSKNIKVRVLPTIAYAIDDDGMNYVKDVKLRFDFFIDVEDKLYSKMTGNKQEQLNTRADFKFNTYNDVYGGLAVRNTVRESSKLFFSGEKTLTTEDKKASNVASFSVPISTNQIGDMLYKVQPSIVFRTGTTEYLVPGALTAETIKIVPKIVGEEEVTPEPAKLFEPRTIVVEPVKTKLNTLGWVVFALFGVLGIVGLWSKYGKKKRRKK